MELKRLTYKRQAAGPAGFTIPEAIVAMAIVGVLITALYGGMSLATFSIRLARENLRATEIMVEKMETLRLFTWDQLLDPSFVPASFTASYSDNGTTNNPSPGITYTGAVSVATFPGADRNYSNDMRVITINLNWTSGGISRTRTLDTYVARYGIQNYILN